MDDFWDETPFGNEFATAFIESLRVDGVSSIEETYTEFSELCEPNIELESKIYAAAAIIKYSLRGDEDDAMLMTIDSWLEKQDDFNAEDFVEDTLLYLEQIKMNSALADYWKEEGIYVSWKSDIQETINSITRWISEVNAEDDDNPDFSKIASYQLDEDEDYS